MGSTEFAEGPFRNSPLGDALNATSCFDSVRMRETGARLTISVGFNLSSRN